MLLIKTCFSSGHVLKKIGATPESREYQLSDTQKNKRGFFVKEFTWPLRDHLDDGVGVGALQMIEQVDPKNHLEDVTEGTFYWHF